MTGAWALPLVLLLTCVATGRWWPDVHGSPEASSSMRGHALGHRLAHSDSCQTEPDTAFSEKWCAHAARVTRAVRRSVCSRGACHLCMSPVRHPCVSPCVSPSVRVTCAVRRGACHPCGQTRRVTRAVRHAVRSRGACPHTCPRAVGRAGPSQCHVGVPLASCFHTRVWLSELDDTCL